MTEPNPEGGEDISKTNYEEAVSGDTIFCWAREDNDFGTRARDSIGSGIVPAKLSRYILSSISEGDRIQNVYSVAYSDSISIYFVRRSGLISGLFGYRIYAYNHSSREFTRSPPYFYGAWMANDESGFPLKMMNRPYCMFLDVTGDGKREIIVKERTHNGTMVNAVQERYFQITDSMELTPILVVETKGLDAFGDCRFERVFDKNKIETFQICPDQEKEKIGTAYLTFSEGEFHISKMSLEPLVSVKPRVLITVTDKDEKLFIKEGYNF